MREEPVSEQQVSVGTTTFVGTGLQQEQAQAQQCPVQGRSPSLAIASKSDGISVLGQQVLLFSFHVSSWMDLAVDGCNGTWNALRTKDRTAACGSVHGTEQSIVLLGSTAWGTLEFNEFIVEGGKPLNIKNRIDPNPILRFIFCHSTR